jgi:hypothetical protein
MEDLKMAVEDASLFIVRATIIRDIVKDVYALGKTIEWELRHTPAYFRRGKKDSYKTKDMKVTLCELKFHNGIRMHIQFDHDDVIYNKLFLIIDKDNDYSVDILSTSVNDLIEVREDILNLLLDLINNRHYDYINPVLEKEHAIMIYDKTIFNSIECNSFSDRNYRQLKCNKTKYVCEDKEMGAIICHDLKAAYVKNGKVFIGGDLK